MTPGKGEAVVELWVWGRSPAQLGWASAGVWGSSSPAGSRGSQTALLAPIIFSPRRETAVLSSKEDGQPSLLTSPARVPAASTSWLGEEPSSHEWGKAIPKKKQARGSLSTPAS